jgi:hypothetical protein
VGRFGAADDGQHTPSPPRRPPLRLHNHSTHTAKLALENCKTTRAFFSYYYINANPYIFIENCKTTRAVLLYFLSGRLKLEYADDGYKDGKAFIMLTAKECRCLHKTRSQTISSKSTHLQTQIALHIPKATLTAVTPTPNRILQQPLAPVMRERTAAATPARPLLVCSRRGDLLPPEGGSPAPVRGGEQGEDGRRRGDPVPVPVRHRSCPASTLWARGGHDLTVRRGTRWRERTTHRGKGEEEGAHRRRWRCLFPFLRARWRARSSRSRRLSSWEAMEAASNSRSGSLMAASDAPSGSSAW